MGCLSFVANQGGFCTGGVDSTMDGVQQVVNSFAVLCFAMEIVDA